MINKVHLVMWLCLYLDNNTAIASAGGAGVGMRWEGVGVGGFSVKRLHGYIINVAWRPRLTIIWWLIIPPLILPINQLSCLISQSNFQRVGKK